MFYIQGLEQFYMEVRPTSSAEPWEDTQIIFLCILVHVYMPYYFYVSLFLY